MLVMDGYKSQKLPASEVRQILGHADGWETEHWLAERKVPFNHDPGEIEDEIAQLDRLFGTSNPG